VFFNPKDNTFIEQMDRGAVTLEYSYLGYDGKAIKPEIRSLGYDWKVGIALIRSFAS
jgi:hypothetical protein